MEGISVSGEVGGAGGAYSYDALKRLDNLWSTLCSDDQTGQFDNFNMFSMFFLFTTI